MNNGQVWWRGVFPDQNAQAYQAEQKLRALERLVRRWDARLQAAVTPEAAAKARAGHAAVVKDLEEHVEAYHLPRQPRREQAGAAR